MSVEAWKSIFDVGAVLLLFLTFLAGAGVLLTGNVINKRQTEQLKTFDSGLTKAKSDLAIQQERAAKAEGDIALAEQHAAEANAKAEGFRLDIAKANESAKQADARAAEATLELARFKTPRTLSMEQQLRIANKVLPFKGQKFAPYVFADTESQDLMNTISRDLLSGEWVLAEPKSDLKIGKAGMTTRSGVVVQSSKANGSVGAILAEALRVEGIDATLESNADQLEATPDVINLIVGNKIIK